MQTVDGIKYIRYDNGETKAYTGWTKKSGDRYYYKNGIMKKNCWLKSNGKRAYFLKKDGTMTVGKITVSGVEYEFDKQGRLVEDAMGISVTASSVSSSGLTLTISFETPADDCTNSLITADGKYMSVFCADEYTVEKYTGNSWISVPYAADEIEWNDEAAELNGAAEYNFNTDWKSIYGDLDKGKYRLCKKIYYDDDDGAWVNKEYYGYFQI